MSFQCRFRFLVSMGLTGHLKNEPENNNATYLTSAMTANVEGQIAASLRSLLNLNPLDDVNIVGYEVGLFWLHLSSFQFITINLSTIGTTLEAIL